MTLGSKLSHGGPGAQARLFQDQTMNKLLLLYTHFLGARTVLLVFHEQHRESGCVLVITSTLRNMQDVWPTRNRSTG
jgi:hypothetical protein